MHAMDYISILDLSIPWSPMINEGMLYVVEMPAMLVAHIGDKSIETHWGALHSAASLLVP